MERCSFPWNGEAEAQMDTIKLMSLMPSVGTLCNLIITLEMKLVVAGRLCNLMEGDSMTVFH